MSYSLNDIAAFISAHGDALTVPQGSINQFMAVLLAGQHGWSLPEHRVLHLLMQARDFRQQVIVKGTDIQAANISSYFRGKEQVISRKRVIALAACLDAAFTNVASTPIRLQADVVLDLQLLSVEDGMALLHNVAGLMPALKAVNVAAAVERQAPIELIVHQRKITSHIITLTGFTPAHLALL